MTDQRQPEPRQAAGFDFNRPTIVSLLYLAGFVVGGIPSLIGLILAYVWKGEPGAGWEASHYQFHIRTFWIGFLAAIVGAILSLIGIGLLIMLAVCVWFAVRSVVALLRAQKHEPISDPKSWLI